MVCIPTVTFFSCFACLPISFALLATACNQVVTPAASELALREDDAGDGCTGWEKPDCKEVKFEDNAPAGVALSLDGGATLLSSKSPPPYGDTRGLIAVRGVPNVLLHVYQTKEIGAQSAGTSWLSYSKDAGCTWQKVPSDPTVRLPSDTSLGFVAAGKQSVYIKGVINKVNVLIPLMIARDGDEVTFTFETPRPLPVDLTLVVPRTKFVFASPQNAQQLWVGTPNGEIHESIDGGKTWSQLVPLDETAGLSKLINPASADNKSHRVYTYAFDSSNPRRVRILAFADNVGVVRSLDGGASWQNSKVMPPGDLDPALKELKATVHDFAFVAGQRRVVWARGYFEGRTASPGGGLKSPQVIYRGLLRSDDGGATFVPVYKPVLPAEPITGTGLTENSLVFPYPNLPDVAYFLSSFRKQGFGTFAPTRVVRVQLLPMGLTKEVLILNNYFTRAEIVSDLVFSPVNGTLPSESVLYVGLGTSSSDEREIQGGLRRLNP